MQIQQLTAFLVRLPLKRPFTHASATRDASENILIRCELADGTYGWGEGVPREYVTGETPIGCLEQLAATPLPEQLAADCHTWPDVIELCERFTLTEVQENPRGCYGNALRCALELSMLDAFGQVFQEPVQAITGHYRPAEEIGALRSKVRYSTAIDSGRGSLGRTALKMRLYGFQQCKVKVGKSGDDDVARLQTIRRWIGPRVDLRLDANEAWHPDELQSRLEPLERLNITCIEQPVPHEEIGSLASLRKELTTPVMLDESLTSFVDAKEAIRLQACDFFNIRLSKCGGFLASLRLAALAQEAGLGFQLGCHPGESGVLSAAGRHWASSVAGIRYLEGSYDRHLFRQLLTHEDITFGYGGWAPALDRPGLGVTMNPRVLTDVTIAQQNFPVR